MTAERTMLTREMIEQEPAGPRLNAWIAEHLGWSRYQKPNSADVLQWRMTGPKQEDAYGPVVTFDSRTGERTEHDWWEYVELPDYSGDIAAAWSASLAAMDIIFSARLRFFDALKEQARLPNGSNPDGLWALLVLKDKFPLAICRAFLLASLPSSAEKS